MYKYQRREQKLIKRKSRMPKHNRNLGQIYYNANYNHKLLRRKDATNFLELEA